MQYGKTRNQISLISVACIGSNPQAPQAIEKAIDEGYINSVDDKVHTYFRNYPDSKWVAEEYPITLRHLLLMSSAIDWNERVPYSNPENSNTAMNLSDDWIAYVLGREQTGKPGVASVYSSGQSMLLGGVVKNATGRYSEEYARDTLFKDLGIDRSLWFKAPDGTRHTGGGLYLKARDLLKVGDLLRSGGVWNNKRVISEAWVNASINDRLPIPKGAPGDHWNEYGYQWWLPTYNVAGQSIPVISGIGYGGQYLGFVPSHNTVFVINSGEWISIRENRKLDVTVLVRERILPLLLDSE